MEPSNAQSHTIGGTTFAFSGVGVDDLEASEYTLVCIAVDNSASLRQHFAEVTKAVQKVVEACRKSPRADNLMLRIITFDRAVDEFHGFKGLMTCNSGDYATAFPCDGPRTALFDAAFTGIGSVDEYGRKLVEDEYDANAIVFVITDGCDNASSMSAGAVAQKGREARGLQGGPTAEGGLESLLTILIGVNVQDSYVSSRLKEFETEGEFDQYVEVDNATAATLAKLAAFVSHSISSQSQALGSGGPSQTIDPGSLAI